MTMIKAQTLKGLKRKIAIFIDAANIFYSTRTLGWKLDYEKFLNYWKKNGKITGAYFYTAIISSRAKQLKFYSALRSIGYEVITRELKIIKDKKNKIIVHKGNFDVKLAIDIVLKAKEFNIAVLASGDSDFEPVVDYLRKLHKKVIVVSSRGHIARELIKSASIYLPLEKIKEEVKKDD